MDKITLPFRPSTLSAMVIDLGALVHNYNFLKSQLGPRTSSSAVVKADAYGLGMSLVAPTLQDAGCDEFFVADTKEGTDLRSILDPSAEIYVLSGLIPGDEELYINNHLVPVLNDLSQVERWNKTAKTYKEPLPAIIQMDSGMMRTGLGPHEVGQLGLMHVSNLELRYVMSHLACAYDPQNGMNQQQLEIFDTWRRAFPIAPASLANSGGIFLDERFHMDMVRPGLALYGSALACPQQKDNFRTVVKVYAKILQTSPLLKGHALGYDSTFVAPRPSRIATVGVGYGDGYIRSLSNKGHIYIAGYKAPIVGRVSMDLLTVDITDIPEDACCVGDWTEVMGDHVSVDDLAEMASTAPWELLTNLSHRSHRHYIPPHVQSTERKAS